MTKKQKIIEAAKATLRKYRNPKGNVFNKFNSCAMCEAIGKKAWTNCIPCPLAHKDGDIGCSEFKSSVLKGSAIVVDEYGKITNNTGGEFSKYMKTKIRKQLKARANFYEDIIPILESMPEKRFTRSGWKFTDDRISREW